MQPKINIDHIIRERCVLRLNSPFLADPGKSLQHCHTQTTKETGMQSGHSLAACLLLIFFFFAFSSLASLAMSTLCFRYPSFVDALRDLDDCLCMIFLFANFPQHRDIQVSPAPWFSAPQIQESNTEKHTHTLSCSTFSLPLLPAVFL